MVLAESIESFAMTQTQAGGMSQGEFEAFYLRTAPKLHGYLCRLSRDPATADEVLQEAYIRMLGLPAMEEAHARNYLYTTATNILRDRWRKAKREREWSAESVVTESIHSDPNLPIAMAAVMDRLSAQERALLWLAHVEELSHREIAAILDVNERSVRVMVFRAREKAKSILQKAGWHE